MMLVFNAACHEAIEPHLHVQTSGWTMLAAVAKPVFIVRVDYHDPKTGVFEGVSVPVDAP